MKWTASAVLCGVVIVWACAAAGAQAVAEDETLPRPLKDQPPEYYSALAKVHAVFKHFKTAEALQLKALESEDNRAKKERLSFELVDQIYVRARWWDKAAAELLRTIRLADGRNGAQLRKYHIDRAHALKEAGKREERLKELEIIVGLSGDKDQKRRALLQLHAALKQAGKLEEKIAEYEAAAKKNPKDKAMLRMLAEVYYGDGLLNLPGKAIQKYQQIRKIDPDDVGACEHLARLYVEAKQRERALALYERLMALDAKRFELYLNEAMSHGLGEDDEKVIAWAKKLSERFPKRSVVPLRIANLYSNKRRPADAAKYYRKTVDLLGEHPSKLSVYTRLITSQIAAGQYATAEGTCREAAKLDILSPSSRRALRNLLNRARELQGKRAEE